MLEDYFSVAFSECYVRSSSMLGPAALEAARCAASYSPLLRSLLGIEQDVVVGLMAPCIRGALAVYQDRHLKEVVRLMVASDTSWVLGRFLISPPSPSPLPPHHAHSYSCLLTSSGRKFLTLVHEFVHDVACPMLNLGILDDDGASVLVAELFREYMNSILELTMSSNRQAEAAAAPGPGAEMEILDDGDEQQQQQYRYRYIISVLINCSTLVSLFPAIRTSSPPPGPSLQVIKEAAGHLIRDTIMSLLSESQGKAAAQPQQEAEGRMTMPSLAFQVVFLQMRRLKDAADVVYGSTCILSVSGEDEDEDGTMKKLLRELMEAIISWLEMEMEMGSSWILHGVRQAQLDIHFLIEIARLVGGDLDITASALDLLRKAQDKLQDPPSRTSSWAWAADAAKHAVQVLLHKHNNMTIGFGSSSSGFDDDMDGSAAAATSSAEAVEEEVSDEFISIDLFEEEDDEEKKLNAPSSDDN